MREPEVWGVRWDTAWGVRWDNAYPTTRWDVGINKHRMVRL